MRNKKHRYSIPITKIGMVFLFLVISSLMIGCEFGSENHIQEDDIWDRYRAEVVVIQRSGNVNYSDSTVVAISIYDYPDYKPGEDQNMILHPVRNAIVLFDTALINLQEDDLYLALLGDYSKLIFPQLTGGSEHLITITINEWGTISRTIEIPEFIDLYGLPEDSIIETGDTLFLSIGEHPHDESVFLRSNYDFFSFFQFENDSLSWIIPSDIPDTLRLDLFSGIEEPSEVIEIFNDQSMEYSYYGRSEQRFELYLNKETE